MQVVRVFDTHAYVYQSNTCAINSEAESLYIESMGSEKVPFQLNSRLSVLSILSIRIRGMLAPA
jgi:hypothetical protein